MVSRIYVKLVKCLNIMATSCGFKNHIYVEEKNFTISLGAGGK